MIELSIKEHLLLSLDIQKTVCNRIYAGRAPQGAKRPLIIIQTITNSPEYNLCGEVGQRRDNIQIDSYGNTPREAYDIADQCRIMLSGYRGYIGKTDPNYVQSVQVQNGNQFQVAPQDASDEWYYRFRQDYSMFVTNQIPNFEDYPQWLSSPAMEAP